MRGEESRNTERERRRGMVRKAKLSKRKEARIVDVRGKLSRWMGEESEEEKRMIVGHEMMDLLVGEPFKGDAGLSAASVESMVIK